METQESELTAPRIPPAIDGVQVNFCKNPSDAAKWTRGDRYKRSGDKDGSSLVCLKCGETIPFKSNHGVAEELRRMVAFFTPIESVGCKNKKCPNKGITVAQDSNLHISFGLTEVGSQRFRCKTCGRTFSIPLASNLRLRKTSKSTEVFKLLTCKVALLKIAKRTKLSTKTVHDMIHRIHRQCLLFAANRERSLPERKFKRLYTQR